MAEGFSMTIQTGSDAEIEVTCTTCEEDGIKKGAVNYCSTCKQYFCTACSKCHARFPATKGHTVTDIHTKEQPWIDVAIATVFEKCLSHPNRNIEMYCGQHDMVYCALCVAKDHRTCTWVREVNDAIEPKMNHSELQLLIGKVDILQTKLQESKNRKQENVKQLEAKEKEVVEEIKDVRTLLVRYIDKLQDTALTSLDNTLEELVTQIKKEITEAVDMEKNLQKCRSQVASSESLVKSQRFIRQILGQRTLAEAEGLLSSLDSYESKQIELNVNKNLYDFIKNATYIAQPKKRITCHDGRLEVPRKVKNITKVNVKVSDDSSTCKITGITQLPDSTIVICDSANRKLKKLDGQLKVSDYCHLDSDPWGVCCTGDNEVAVKLSDDNIQFVSIGTTLSKTRKIKISNGNILGIECISSQLWVSQGKGINVYSKSGILLKDNVKPFGIEGTQCPQGIAGSNENVYVSGFKYKIFCLDDKGCSKTVLGDKCLGWSRGVCILKDNIVCAAGYDSNNIVMFSKEGKCLGELVESGQGILKPWSLCNDKWSDKVIVGCRDSDKIIVLSLS